MRSGINFNSTDGPASKSHPTRRLTEDNHDSVSADTGDSILDDLFSEDDSSSSDLSGAVSGRSTGRTGASNSLMDSDYNPLLDDDDDSESTSETVGNRSRIKSDSMGASTQKVPQYPYQNHAGLPSSSHVSRHSVSKTVKSDSVSRETMHTDSAGRGRAPLRRPDTQQGRHDSVKTISEEKSPSVHNEPGHPTTPSSKSQVSSDNPQPSHRRRIGIPSSSHSQETSQESSVREKTNPDGSQQGFQKNQKDADSSSGERNRSTIDDSNSDNKPVGSFNRRSVTLPARHSADSVSRETSAANPSGSAQTQHSDRPGSLGSDDETAGITEIEGTPSVQSSTTNTGKSSGHYWVGSNVPGKQNKGSQAGDKESSSGSEDSSSTDTPSADPAPRKRGRGRPRNFLNTILPENRGNDFAERRWQGARQTKDFAPHVGFPVRTKEEEAELRRRQRAGETIPGRKKRDPKKKYHRKTITEKDILVFELTALTGACTYNPVAVLLGMKHASSARKRVLGLKEMKMLRTAHSLKIDGVMFDLTRRAVNQMYKNGSGVDKDCISLKKDVTGLKSRETSYHNTILAYTLAKECALYGLRPAMFYNEDWMARRCSGSYKGIGIEARNERVAEYRRQMMKAYRELSQGIREGIMERYPMLWVPCGKEDDLGNYSAWHQPDLILNRDWRNEKGQSKSVAYEIEMTPKSPGDMDKIMRTLGWSGWFAYGEVRYVVVSDMIGRAVERSRERIVKEFRNLSRTAPDSQDRAFYKSGANFLANALTIERMSDINGNLFDTGDQDWI